MRYLYQIYFRFFLFVFPSLLFWIGFIADTACHRDRINVSFILGLLCVIGFRNLNIECWHYVERFMFTIQITIFFFVDFIGLQMSKHICVYVFASVMHCGGFSEIWTNKYIKMIYGKHDTTFFSNKIRIDCVALMIHSTQNLPNSEEDLS